MTWSASLPARCCNGPTVDSRLTHSPTPRRLRRPSHPNLLLLGFRTRTQLCSSWSTTQLSFLSTAELRIEILSKSMFGGLGRESRSLLPVGFGIGTCNNDEGEDVGGSRGRGHHQHHSRKINPAQVLSKSFTTQIQS